MRRSAITALSAALVATTAIGVATVSGTSAGATTTAKYTVRTLHFAVRTGPAGTTVTLTLPTAGQTENDAGADGQPASGTSAE